MILGQTYLLILKTLHEVVPNELPLDHKCGFCDSANVTT